MSPSIKQTIEELEAQQVAEAVALLDEAQEEASVTTMYFTIGGVEYEATFKKQGEDFVLQELKSSKASTRTWEDLMDLGKAPHVEIHLEVIDISGDVVSWDDNGGSVSGGDSGGSSSEQADEPEEETIVDESGTTWNYAEATAADAAAEAAAGEDTATDDEIEKDEGYTDDPVEEETPIEDDPVEEDPADNSAMPEASTQVMHFTVTNKATGETLVETYTNLGNSETTQEGVSGATVSGKVTVNGKTKTLGSGNKECQITLPNRNVVTLKYKDKYDTWAMLIRKQQRLKLSSSKGIVKYNKRYWILDDEEKPVEKSGSVGASYESSTRVYGLRLYANVDKNVYSTKIKKNNFRKGDKIRVRVEFNGKSEGAVMRDAFSVFKATSSVSVSKVEENVFEIEAVEEPTGKAKIKKFSVVFAYEDYNGTVRKAKLVGGIGKGEGGSQTDVESVTLSKTELELEVGETATLTATVKPDNTSSADVTWKSSDENVATVSTTGVVTAIAAGTATITCTATNGTADNTADDKTATCAVTVSPSAAEINELYANLCDGEGMEITAEMASEWTIATLVGDVIDYSEAITEAYVKALAEKICTEKSLTSVVLLMGGNDESGYDFYVINGSSKSKTHLAATATVPSAWSGLSLFYVSNGAVIGGGDE